LGLSASDPGVDEHKFLSDVVESALTYDQLNVSELLCFEHVARRYQMWEEIYAQSLREAESGSGSADWLDERQIFLGQGRSKGHALVCPLLEQWVAEQLKSESAVLKERRKGREEKQASRASGLAGGSDLGAPAIGGDVKSARGRGRGKP
jgi:hypothetical protein